MIKHLIITGIGRIKENDKRLIMEIKKYKLTEEIIKVDDSILYRIEALRDFNDVKKGDKGGFVEKEENLSQYGDCWVYDDAKVFGDAEVYYDAIVRDNAIVRGKARVCQDAVIRGNARIYDNALVHGNAIVRNNVIVCDNAVVCGNAEIRGNAVVYRNARVRDKAVVFDDAEVCDNAWVCGSAEIYGNARVFGNAEIIGDAKVESAADYIVFKNWWSSGRYFTWTRSNNMWKVGCFYGTGEQLIEKAYKDSVKSGREYEKIVRYSETVN